MVVAYQYIKSQVRNTSAQRIESLWPDALKTHTDAVQNLYANVKPPPQEPELD
jgi:hypothetical protein